MEGSTMRGDGDEGGLSELLERRERVRGWLDRLDREADANPRVSERVRRDYTTQLHEIDGELADRYDLLRDEAARLEQLIAQAATAHEAAVDALEEVELRHRIGEIDSAAWQSRKSDLESKARVEGEALDELRARATGLAEIIDSLRGPGAAGEPLPEIEPAGRTPDVVSESVEWGREESVPPTPAPDGDPVPLHPDEEDLELTRPGPGVKCVDCGYTNDFDALYCGVCGVDLS